MPKEVKAPKKEKKPKDPNAPKKAKGAYIFFCNEERAKIKEEQPDLKQTEIMGELGKRWKELSDDAKAPFNKLAEEDKARYEEEMKNYDPPPEFKKEAKEKKPRAKKPAKKKKEEEEEDEPEEDED